MSEKIGVAVVGLGVGVQHAIAYMNTGRCELRYLWDLDSERIKNVLSELRQGRPARSFQEILDDPSASIISIASFDDAHYDQALAALRAHRHVFVEKPLCRSSEELRSIRKTWLSTGGSHLSSNLVLRAAPLYRWLKDAIAQGELGDIYAFDGEYLYGRLEKITRGWRSNVSDYSVLLGGGIHLVDLMLDLTGQRPVRATAAGNSVCTTGTTFKYNDYVTVCFEFASGLIGRVTANFGCVHPHQHVVRVFGTKGTFLYDDQGSRLYQSRNPEVLPQKMELSPLPGSKGDLIPMFVDRIIRQQDNRDEAQHEFDVVAVCVAGDRSLALSKTVDIQYE